MVGGGGVTVEDAALVVSFTNPNGVAYSYVFVVSLTKPRGVEYCLAVAITSPQ